MDDPVSVQANTATAPRLAKPATSFQWNSWSLAARTAEMATGPPVITTGVASGSTTS